MSGNHEHNEPQRVQHGDQPAENAEVQHGDQPESETTVNVDPNGSVTANTEPVGTDDDDDDDDGKK